MAKAKKPVSKKKPTVKKAVAKKETKKVIKKKEVQNIIAGAVPVPYIPRRIDKLPPPKED
tara:strand:- start:2513 stop:2692 length:180 start_codon:yes stop_codon:yes gene_type:complete